MIQYLPSIIISDASIAWFGIPVIQYLFANSLHISSLDTITSNTAVLQKVPLKK